MDDLPIIPRKIIISYLNIIDVGNLLKVSKKWMNCVENTKRVQSLILKDHFDSIRPTNSILIRNENALLNIPKCRIFKDIKTLKTNIKKLNKSVDRSKSETSQEAIQNEQMIFKDYFSFFDKLEELTIVSFRVQKGIINLHLNNLKKLRVRNFDLKLRLDTPNLRYFECKKFENHHLNYPESLKFLELNGYYFDIDYFEKVNLVNLEILLLGSITTQILTDSILLDHLKSLREVHFFDTGYMPKFEQHHQFTGLYRDKKFKIYFNGLELQYFRDDGYQFLEQAYSKLLVENVAKTSNVIYRCCLNVNAILENRFLEEDIRALMRKVVKIDWVSVDRKSILNYEDEDKLIEYLNIIKPDFLRLDRWCLNYLLERILKKCDFIKKIWIYGKGPCEDEFIDDYRFLFKVRTINKIILSQSIPLSFIPLAFSESKSLKKIKVRNLVFLKSSIRESQNNNFVEFFDQENYFKLFSSLESKVREGFIRRDVYDFIEKEILLK